MSKAIEALRAARAEAVREYDEAIAKLEVGTPLTRKSLPEAWGGAPKSRATKDTKPVTRKRGHDSELTKARKRIASAKRFGKEPAAADLELVAVNEGATSEAAAE